MSTATLKRNPLPKESTWLKAEVSAQAIGVDRELNVLRGMVIAQEGAFKTEGRGSFDLKGLKQMKALINKEPNGLKSNFGHPNDSGDRASAPGYHLGRVKNPRIDVLRMKRDGEEVLVNALRGDLFFDKSALEPPPGGGKPRGLYVMDLAESDPDAISTSVQIEPEIVEQMDSKGKPLLDPKTGEAMAPIWYPLKLHASDIVNVGDAVDGILSADIDIEQLSRDPVRVATQLLNSVFKDADREVVEARCLAFLKRCLDNRFGPDPHEVEWAEINARMDEALRKSRELNDGAAKTARIQVDVGGAITAEAKPVGLSREVAELETMLAERGA